MDIICKIFDYCMFVGLHCGIAWMPGLFSLEGAVSVTVPGTWNLLQYQVPGTPNQQVPCHPGTRYCTVSGYKHQYWYISATSRKGSKVPYR